MIPRQHPRFAVNSAASFARDHQPKADITNLSLGGCCLQNVAPGIDMKRLFTMFLQMSAGEQPLRIDAAQVRWDAASNFGVRFLFLERLELKRLEHYVARLASQQAPGPSMTAHEKKTPPVLSHAEFNARVASKAYEIFERRGTNTGGSLANWLETERLVKEELLTRAPLHV